MCKNVVTFIKEIVAQEKGPMIGMCTVTVDSLIIRSVKKTFYLVEAVH